MTVQQIINALESFAPPVLQEHYDNSGLITGDRNWTCTGVLVTLDSTEEVVEEAVAKGCNLIVAHHPILFKGIKQLTGKDYVERTIIRAIKQDVAIYAIHTNLDNVANGVNNRIADLLGLINRKILQPKKQLLYKLQVYVPAENLQKLEKALFEAGAGNIGKYSECSFNTHGTGSFKPENGANPAIGKVGERHFEPEIKLEMIFPVWKQAQILKAMHENHPYEEVAYEVIALENNYQEVGPGILGRLNEPVDEVSFLGLISDVFKVKVVKHTPLLGKKVQNIAVCGGAGSFLTSKAIAAGADVFITSDVKYHEFFDAEGKIILADVGHFESEQYTIDLLTDFLRQKFPNFALQKSEVRTNPVHCFISEQD